MFKVAAAAVLALICLSSSFAETNESRVASESQDVFQFNAPRANPFAGPSAQPFQTRCCKICREGYACGDTCISREKVCRVGAGCACDA